MIIVLVFVALATVLAFALLNSQSTMVQAGDNGARAAQADALAESGMQLASYYLQNPAAAPVLNAQGFYPGQTGVSLGSNVNGTVDITVTQLSSSTYSISSKSHYSTGSDTAISRSCGAVATVQYGYTPTDATSVNGGITIPSNMTINGNLRSNGGIKLNGGTVTGNIIAPSVTNLLGGLLNLLGSILTPPDNSNPVADKSVIKDYRTYTYNGKTYSAQLIPSTASGTYGPTATNPLGVYYNTGDVTLNNAVTINGTLLAPQGKLVLKNSLTINAPAEMPALVVNSDIQFTASSKNLISNGLSWIGGVLSKGGTATNDAATFNGAAQFAGSSVYASGWNGTITMNYDKAKATVANFLPNTGTTAYAVKLSSFSNN